uniref:Uncharacterized protein n=1 Tax=Siphoviridae sp. ctxMM9 TaxID=2827973 RepID=A0A8S5T797_9CAUD|nr:MAG TPA: hypothetical protein [Siphoviridae sp. ctxMM9]
MVSEKINFLLLNMVCITLSKKKIIKSAKNMEDFQILCF